MIPILVSQRIIETPEYPEIREALDIRWGVFLQQCGLLPVPVSLDIPLEHYFDTVAPKGILLTGGNDLAAVQDTEVNRRRDKLETGLIEYAIRQEIPLLGVCRGMQMVCHYFKSTLEKVEGHAPKPHSIEVERKNAFSPFYPTRHQVNSYHQYGITKLGPDLKAVARASDSTIEAVEHPTKPIYGMMWHPERENPFRSEDAALFQRIFSKQLALAGKDRE